MSNTLVLEDGQKLFRVKVTYMDDSVNEVAIRAYNKHQATLKAKDKLVDGDEFKTIITDEIMLDMYDDMFFIGEE